MGYLSGHRHIERRKSLFAARNERDRLRDAGHLGGSYKIIRDGKVKYC